MSATAKAQAPGGPVDLKAEGATKPITNQASRASKRGASRASGQGAADGGGPRMMDNAGSGAAPMDGQ